jgi:hypothetical protein
MAAGVSRGQVAELAKVFMHADKIGSPWAGSKSPVGSGAPT